MATPVYMVRQISQAWPECNEIMWKVQKGTRLQFPDHVSTWKVKIGKKDENTTHFLCTVH